MADDDDAERMQHGQHGDDDAGVAEARRQIEREIALQPRDLRPKPASAARPPESSAVFTSTRVDRHAGKARRLRVLADGAHLEAEARCVF